MQSLRQRYAAVRLVGSHEIAGGGNGVHARAAIEAQSFAVVVGVENCSVINVRNVDIRYVRHRPVVVEIMIPPIAARKA